MTKTPRRDDLGAILAHLLRDAHHLTTALPEARKHYREPATGGGGPDAHHTPPGPRTPPGALQTGPHTHTEAALRHVLQAAAHAADAINALHRIGDPKLAQPAPRRCTNCSRDLGLLDQHTKCPACRSSDSRKKKAA
jgi:hypothetical protein